ncbi:MAG: hypothetical protein HN742_40585 [Lentisphaerae bacterium]|jgi:hypothetical protein|nr:hypothetical protein [Lentisphaerota bacterium]MBT5610314.1 hypothetical protein [Lentisphaerota bacterium]MBT7056395.1 hypothetical protein [Lentisphaerota bacterium]MBT7848233.1 hypothetical protein [Lentisphaerota bacterium]
MADQPVRENEFLSRELGAFACLTVLVLAFYGRLLFGHVLYGADFLTFWLEQKLFIRSQLLNWSLPALDPYVACGRPLLGELRGGALYPLNVLLLPGDDLIGVHVFVVCHYVLAAWMMYAFVRLGCGGRSWSAALVAFAYACGGYVWSMADHVSFLSAPWVPLYFLGLVRAASGTPTHRRAAAGACVVGAALLCYCGNPQQARSTFLFGGVLLMIVTVRLGRRRAWFGVRHFAEFYIGTLLVAALLAAPQLVPFLVGANEGAGGGSGVMGSPVGMAFVPLRLVEYIVPLFFGPRQGFGCALRTFYGGAFPWSESVFIGIPLLVGITAVPRRSWRSALGIWLGTMIGLGVLLAVGGYLPFHGVLRAIVPGIVLGPNPETYLFWVHFGGVSLGGIGIEVAGRNPACARRALAVSSVLVGGLILCAVVLMFGYLPWRELYADLLRRGGSAWEPPHFLRWQLIQLTGSLLAGVTCIAVFTGRVKLLKTGRFPKLALLVTAVHLHVLGLGVRWAVPRRLVDTVPAVNEIVPDADPRQFRVFSTAGNRMGNAPPYGEGDRFVTHCLEQYAGLAGNTPPLFGLRTLSGFPNAFGNEDMRANLGAALMSGQYVVVPAASVGSLPPGHRLVGTEAGGEYALLENLRALPRIHTTNQHTLTEEAACWEVALQALALRGRGSGIRGESFGPDDGSTPAGVELYFRPQTDASAVVLSRLPNHYREDITIPPPSQAPEIVEDAPGRLTVRCPGPVWLVVRDWFHVGWGATVAQGGPVEITRVDGGVMAVYLPAGMQTVSLVYRPPGLLAGLCLLVVGVGLSAAFLCLPRVLSLAGRCATDRGSDAR